MDPKPEEREISTRDQLEQILNDHTLRLWYPKVVDTNNGGFYSNYSFDWTKESQQNKFIVTQSRHVWTLSKAFAFYPDRLEYKKLATHGFDFLRNFMWDTTYGGFYQLVDSTGQVPIGEYMDEKRSYGNSFGIYGLAAYFQISRDSAALDLAIKAFRWLDKHAHDNEHGGYFQYLYRDGTIIPRSALQEGYNAGDKAHVGLKDYNSSIHILEAFTELYMVWQDQLLRERLLEMYQVVSEIMVDRRGFLKLHFYPDWSLVEDEALTAIVGERSFFTNHVTFGHDVETAFLLLEAAEVLRIDERQIMPKAKQMVDHALLYGWDNEIGGFYEQGKYINEKMEILDEGKNWWSQAEGLHSLLLMHTHFPDEAYLQKFELMLSYIQDNLLDHRHQGWYTGGIDHNQEFKRAQKAQIWKGTYHTSRSLMRCIRLLEQNSH